MSVGESTEGTPVAKKATKKKASKPAPTPKVAAPKKAPVKAALEDNDEMIHLADQLKMLGDKTRIGILSEVDNEKSVQDLCDGFGLSQPAVSHHLALLRRSRLIIPRRDGKKNRYSLTKVGEVMLAAIKSVMATKE